MIQHQGLFNVWKAISGLAIARRWSLSQLAPTIDTVSASAIYSVTLRGPISDSRRLFAQISKHQGGFGTAQ